MRAQGKVQKRPQKTFKFTCQADPWHRNQQSKQASKQNNIKQETLGKGENLISTVTTLVD